MQDKFLAYRQELQNLLQNTKESLETPCSFLNDNSFSGLNIPIIVILGSTASGKTDFAKQLFASDSNSPYAGLGVVISADSMQVYEGMDIGTAKADLQLQSVLPHRLVSVIQPNKQYCAGDFIDDVKKLAKEIIQDSKIPVIVGGTGFYLKSFIEGLPTTPQSDPEYRQLLHKRLENEGIESLFLELKKIDPVTANKIHKNDHYRILRGLEVFYSSGIPLSNYEVNSEQRKGYSFCIIGIKRHRNEVYLRVEERVKAMMNLGLPFEFQKLIDKGFTKDDPGMQAIGYREFFMFSNWKANLDSIEKIIIHDTKKYVKRQETFFKLISKINWFDPCSLDCSDKIIEIGRAHV